MSKNQPTRIIIWAAADADVATTRPPSIPRRGASSRPGLARIPRFSSVIERAEKTDQQHHDDDLEFHFPNLEGSSGIRLT